MIRTRRYAWLLLGLGGILLAVVSFQMRGTPTPKSSVQVAAPAEALEADAEADMASGLVAPEEIHLSDRPVNLDAKPPSAQVNPMLAIPQARHIPKNRSVKRRVRPAPEPEYRVEDKTDAVPEIRDTPPLKMAEPSPLEPRPSDPILPDPSTLERKGQRQAWNDFDSEPPPADVPGDNSWAPMDAPEPAVPADDYGFDAPPPPAPPDMEGDFQPEPTDNFDYGGSGD
jgi:hypothetical protein